jgi:hypothetical protein
LESHWRGGWWRVIGAVIGAEWHVTARHSMANGVLSYVVERELTAREHRHTKGVGEG